MSSDIKLLPCPFCGGKAELRKINNGVYIESDITCENRCVFMHDFSGTDDKGLINRWNTRKPMDRIVEQLEENSYIETVSDLDPYWDIPTKVVRLERAIDLVKAGGVDG